jgi:hypothetical protein
MPNSSAQTLDQPDISWASIFTMTHKRGSSVSGTSTTCRRYWSDMTCKAVTLSGHRFLQDSGLCPLPMRSTALPAVSLIPRWLVPSYTLPRVSAPTWLLQQVFSLDSSISGGKWTDSHWKAAKRLVRYIRGATDLCLTFDGNCGSSLRCGVADWSPSEAMPCYSTAILGPRPALLLPAAGPSLSRRPFLPQLLSLLPRFKRPTNLYHHQSIRRQPPAHGRVQWHAPVVVGARRELRQASPCGFDESGE